MKTMDFCHVTSILLATLAMTIAVSTALPYPSWFNPEASQLVNDERYPPELNNRIRQMLALKMMGQELSPMFLDKSDNEPENTRAKRLDFGFAGLDNMDHILSTLDRKQAMRAGVDSNFFKHMKSHGYNGAHNMEKLTKLMANVG